jgi:hypothetical protein
MRWVNSESAARYRGRIMAQRVRNHGLLSKEAREKINSEIGYFQGAARDAYINEIRTTWW